MLTAHSVAQIRAAEESLVAAAGSGSSAWDDLMQPAARGLAEALGEIAAGDLLLALIGPGNNGGDALYAVAHLLGRGVRVDLCLLDPGAVHEAGLEAALAAGAHLVEEPGGQRTVLDAVLGIGARPGLEGRAAQWVDWIDRTAPFTIAVDVPSGIDVDGGTRPGAHVDADATVTFGSLKPCLLLPPASSSAGSGVTVIDIGLRPHLEPGVVESIETRDSHLLLDALGDADGHKYSRGVVGVAAGSDAYAGAAFLCVAGAQAGPAGMVRFAGTDTLAARVVDRAPEVVAAPGRVQSWVVGPGGDEQVADLMDVALADGVPVVLDASALDHLPEAFDSPVLLTPHAGELARMLGADRAAVESAPLVHARRAAERWEATVLLKGSRTLVVSPEGRVRVNLSGTPWLGTAGAGDVLAGFIGSLLANGLDPFDAGSLGAFLHGAAAVAANPGGPITASEVARALPGVVARFCAGTLVDVHRETWS
ncbi:bifunctional ADP-dependent NAD(P)H-hydrate dehydratase/NAD(P)H-hydrate epimerase [Aeromicrobium sp. CF3.5]|uniref:bifunctional ADP-dependent NAD(P)H-hydrate dehydratase/NAD(P)H-hydrate epimerase n=1 Tax=Aeromicrobium sp. CF3.5 TaxID=3373078 RepID=UPI003EE653F8